MNWLRAVLTWFRPNTEHELLERAWATGWQKTGVNPSTRTLDGNPIMERG